MIGRGILPPGKDAPPGVVPLKQKLRIRYSPDMKEVYIVEQDGTLTPVRLLNKVENASVKREKFMLCRGEE